MKVKSDYIPTWYDVLRKEREKQGRTQNEVADLLGITPMGLSHFELGRREPKLSFLDKWAQILGHEVYIEIKSSNN
jgi:transcriptional regulator with XRE-family HTH domain